MGKRDGPGFSSWQPLEPVKEKEEGERRRAEVVPRSAHRPRRQLMVWELSASPEPTSGAHKHLEATRLRGKERTFCDNGGGLFAAAVAASFRTLSSSFVSFPTSFCACESCVLTSLDSFPVALAPF